MQRAWVEWVGGSPGRGPSPTIWHHVRKESLHVRLGRVCEASWGAQAWGESRGRGMVKVPSSGGLALCCVVPCSGPASSSVNFVCQLPGGSHGF